MSITNSPVRFFHDRLRSPHACLIGAAFLLLVSVRSEAAENVLSFGSSSHYVSTTGQVATAAFTFEAWFRMTAGQTENQIISQYIGGNAGRMIVALRNDKPAFFIAGWMDGNPVDFTNKWTHIAVTRTNTTCNIYINGVLNKTGALTASTLSPTGIRIGGINPPNSGFRGQIADVRAWTVARSQADIQTTMNVRLSGDEPGLAYYWRMNEGAPSTSVIDSAVKIPSPAHGTITGASWTTSDLPIASDTPEGAWNAPTGGTWSRPANWLNGSVASGSDAVARFTNQPPAAVTITNDLASLRIGSLLVDAASSHTFTGNALTLSNQYARSQVAFAGGAHTLDLPLVTTAHSMTLEALAPATLAIDGVISGPGGVALNPFASGGGRVTSAASHTYTGPTATGSGTLLVPALTAGGAAGPLGASSADPANLLLGPGTLRYTGPDAATDRGFTVNAGASPVRAAVLDTDADLTFSGQLLAASGSFVKTGEGTVTFTYPGPNVLSRNDGSVDGVLNIGAAGDSPTIGFSGFTIAKGRVVFDAPGQTNTVYGRTTVGTCTTTNAGAETAAELLINSGAFLSEGTLGIGRNNGNAVTAGPNGLSSRLTVNGGYVRTPFLSVGLHLYAGLTGYNYRPVCDINGGLVEATGYLALAEREGGVGTLNVRGGTLRCTSTSYSEGLRVGWNGATGGVGIVNLSGGLIDVRTDVGLATLPGSSGTLSLHGGTLTARNITKTSVADTYTEIVFNGGLFMPHSAGRTLAGHDLARVSTNGAAIDTSLADYTVAQDLLHDANLGTTPDGGLVKLGANTLTFAAPGSTYTGPTVVSNGTLRLLSNLPADSALQVAPDGEVRVGGSATQTLSAVSVALAPDGTLAFAFTADGTANDRLNVATSPALGTGRVTLYLQDTDLPFTRNGLYTILTYSGVAPDVSGLTCANPVFGKSYAFAASGGSVTVTLSTEAAGASVWNVDGDGAWATGSNWTTAPTPGGSVRFDDAITAPRTVTTSGQTVGNMYFNSTLTYTLGGSGLTLAPGAGIFVEAGHHVHGNGVLTLPGDTPIVFAPGTSLRLGHMDGPSAALSAQGDGTLTLDAIPDALQSLTLAIQELVLDFSYAIDVPIVLSRTLFLHPADGRTVTLNGAISGSGGLTKAGSSILVPTAANSFTGPTAVNAGTLSVGTLADGGSPSAIGASSSASANLLLGPGTFRYTGPSVSVNRGYTVSAGGSPIRAAVLRAEGDITFAGQILSTSGAFIKTGPGTVSYTYPGPNTLNSHQSATPFARQDTGASGDSPTVGFAGFNINQGTVILGAPGQTNTVAGRVIIGLCTTTAANAETTGELILNDGALRCTTSFGVGWNNGTAVTAGPAGLQPKLTVNGGYLLCQTLSLGLNNIGLSGFNARPVFVQYGGTVEMTGGMVLSETSGAVTRADINGGLLRATPGGNSIRIGGTGEATMTIRSNAVVDAASVVRLAEGAGGNSKGRLNLDGGTLIAQNILKGSGTEAVLSFNGGTFRPRAAGQTLSGLTAATVSTNGACFDTALASYTIAQNLLTDPALAGAVDGGLLKFSTNSLSLTGTANTFNGPVRVAEGLLRARLGATNDLFVAADAAFDALGETCTLGDLTGTGLLTNGTIAVTGTLDAGTNGAPAGAAMTVQNLSLAGGSTFACDWVTNALGQVVNDTVEVTDNLAPQGPGFFDLGRDDNDPIVLPFQLTVMSCDTVSGSFAGWKALNTGLPPERAVVVSTTVSGGWVTLKIQYGGTLIQLR